MAAVGRIKDAYRLVRNEIPKESSRLQALTKIVDAVTSISSVSVNVSSTILTERDELEVIIESGVELENVVVEFEGVSVEPVRLRKLLKEVVKVKPDFQPGKRNIAVRVSYDYDDLRYNLEKVFEIEFKPAQAPDESLKKMKIIDVFRSYRLVEFVGKGAFADVYKALDDADRIVAIKIYRGSERAFIEEIGNFVQLTRKLGDVPYIVRPIDYGVEPRPFVVMEFYPMTLRDLVGSDVELKKKLRLMHRVSKALSYAHSKGVYHGDLKHENILVFEEGGEYYPVIADWGGGFTLGYSAPEVYRSGGKEIDDRSDVYSFGVMLYELVTGKPLFSDPLDYMARCDSVRVEMKDRKLQEIVNACLLSREKGQE